MKHQPWSNLLPLLGNGGDRIMIDLILDCGIFIPVEGGAGNLQQLSGTPLCELKPTSMAKENHISLLKTPKITLAGSIASRVSDRATAAQTNKPMAIRFVRHRMLYAKAALNAKSDVRFGLRHI
ncbi:Telomerase reverse transcriptase, partial [Cryomyces antarcticus]